MSGELNKIEDKDAVMRNEQLETAYKYVKENIKPAQIGRKCIDGRYPTGENQLARPAADLGYVMALLAVNEKKQLGLTPVQCFDYVYNAIIAEGSTFDFHTDQFADPENAEEITEAESHGHAPIGCAHVAKAADDSNSPDYGLPSGKAIRAVIACANNKFNAENEMDKKTIRKVNLKRKHAEKGVLIIESDEFTVNSSSTDGTQMYFIYDRKQDKHFMRKLVDSMKIAKITFEDMESASNMQAAATLKLIAVGKPVYNVTLDSPQKYSVKIAE